jgi:hypothetical protein
MKRETGGGIILGGGSRDDGCTVLDLYLTLVEL